LDTRPSRRDIIKKGIVAGGIAAAAPIVTTFNVPAVAVASQESYRFRYFFIIGSTVGTIADAAQSPCTLATGWASATNGTAADAAAMGLTVTRSAFGGTPAVLDLADSTPNFDFTQAGIRYNAALITTCSNLGSIELTNSDNTATITPDLGLEVTAVYFVVTRPF
jgi:hypothetical protein